MLRHPSDRNQRRLLKKLKDRPPTLAEKEVIDELRPEDPTHLQDENVKGID